MGIYQNVRNIFYVITPQVNSEKIRMAEQKKHEYKYYVVDKRGRQMWSGVKRRGLARLEQRYGEDAIIIGVPKNMDQHHRNVIEPFSHIYSREFGKYELIKSSELEELRERAGTGGGECYVSSRIM